MYRYPPLEIEPLDLTKLCRDRTKLLTTILVFDEHSLSYKSWVKLAQIRLQPHKLGNYYTYWVLDAYYGEREYQEGDSAFCFSIQLIGLEMEYIHYGHTELNAWIMPNAPESLRVPKDAQYGKGEERIPYTPPPNTELYQKLQGLKVRITTGLLPPKQK